VTAKRRHREIEMDATRTAATGRPLARTAGPIGFGSTLSLALLALLFLACGPKDPDVNNDGVVNILDVSFVSSCQGADLATNTACLPADVDGDGDVDLDDLNFVASNFDSPTSCGDLAEGSPCDDGNVCTEGDACDANGSCVGQQQVVCQDDNSCTVDSCDPVVGCQFTPATGQSCDDGNACTVGEVCTAQGSCGNGSGRLCDDINLCTTNGCDPAIGCVFTPRTGQSCDDNDACTLGEVCTASGTCGGGTARVCQDSNECTIDSCDPAVGCRFAVNLGASCTADLCTVSATCQFNGECSGSEKHANCCEDSSDCATTATCCSGIAFPDPGVCILPGEA
jgi:hypothetical protein